MKSREKFPFLLAIITFTILLIITVFSLNINMENKKDEYFDTSINEYNYQIDATLESYSRFSEYIYQTVISEDTYILNLVSEAYTADVATQDIIILIDSFL